MVEPHSSNFRVITTIFWGVRIFRKFTVLNIRRTVNKTSKNMWAATWQNQQNECAPSEDSDQPQWIAKDPRFLHAASEDSDQTGRMPRLIWVFAGRTATLLVLSCCGSCAKHHESNSRVLPDLDSKIKHFVSGAVLLYKPYSVISQIQFFFCFFFLYHKDTRSILWCYIIK